MGRVEHIQNSFTAGVYSPLLKGRRDLEGYYQALQGGKRISVHPHGGLSSDGGFEYCGFTGGAAAKNVELISWRFSNDDEQCYALEFGERYIRVYWGHDRRAVVVTDPSQPYFTGSGLDDMEVGGEWEGTTEIVVKVIISAEGAPDEFDLYVNGIIEQEHIPITGSEQSISIGSTVGLSLTFGAATGHTAGDYWEFYVGQEYEIPTPYLSDEVNDLRVTQRADVMYIYHENHPVRKLIRYDHDDWRLSVVAANEARWLGRESTVKWTMYDITNVKPPNWYTPSGYDYLFAESSNAALLGEGSHTGTIGWSTYAGWYDGVPEEFTNLDADMKYVSIKYEGTITIDEPGTYRFAINVAMGGDFYIDGELKITWFVDVHPIFNPNGGAATQTNYQAHSAAVTLAEGEHTFVLRVANTNLKSGPFGVALAWKKPGDTAYALIPGSQFVKRSESAEVSPATYTVFDHDGVSIPTDAGEMDDVCSQDTAGVSVHETGKWDDRIYFHSNSGALVVPFPLPPIATVVDKPPFAMPDGSGFALQIDGWLYVEEAGTFTFGVDSNDASDFVLHTGDPDSPTASASKYGAGGCSSTFETGWDLHDSGEVTLAAGWYQFRARLANTGWGYGFGVGWKTPSESSWKPIPRENITAGRDDGYPRLGQFFEGRHWMYRDITVWGSKAGQPEDFETGADAGDAMELELDTRQVDLIQAVDQVKDGIIFFTSGSVLKLNSGGQGAITPENRRQEELIVRGSAFIQPVKIGNSIFFVGKDLHTIYQMKYSEALENQEADDVTILASHFFADEIVKIGYQAKARIAHLDVQADLLWALTSGGELYAMTDDEANKIFAWHPHVIEDGDVQSFCFTVGPNGDELYIAVKRDGLARTVECLNPDLCLDCAATLSGTKTPAAAHLASQAVAIRYGDSAEEIAGWTTQTLDASGVGTALTVTSAPDYMEVGLAYEWEAELMPLEKGYQSGGTTIGQMKRWVQVGVEFLESGGSVTLAKSGGRFNYPLLNSVKLALWSGEVNTPVAGYDQEAALVLSGSTPMPVCVLYVWGDVEIV